MKNNNFNDILLLYLKERIVYLPPFFLNRSSLQHDLSVARAGYRSSVASDGYYQFATFIGSNNLSTSEQRQTIEAKNNQLNSSDSYSSSNKRETHPSVDKGDNNWP